MINEPGPFSSDSRIPITRSASRTAETSGLVTTRTRSAAAIAFLKPRSMPAGESISTKSKSLRRSLIRRFISLGETAFLSRVCAAGIRYSSGNFLSRIIACFKRQRPSITSTMSYTIRFSKPRITSRLRRPMSPSMQTTLAPSEARATAIFATAVVLPTPPFPDVMVITCAGM